MLVSVTLFGTAGPMGSPFAPDMLASLWSSAAAVAPVSSGAAAAYRTLFMTLRRLVVGRRLAVRDDEATSP